MSGSEKDVLVVDDSPEIADAIADALRDAGFQTRTAPHGQAALEDIRQRRPALVITDACMPVMDGIELITALRSELVPPVPPVIVVSGFPDMERAALGRGAAAFLHKPLAPDDVVDCAGQVLAQVAIDRRTAERRRQRALAARKAATKAAEAVLAHMDRHGAELQRRGEGLAAFLAGYFGFGTAAVVVPRPDRLEVVAERSAHGEPVPATAAESCFYDIAQTSSSLLVTNVDREGALAGLTRTADIRFFAGVPLVVETTVVGAIALLDTQPASFSADDLALLEHLGRNGSRRLREAATAGARLKPQPLVDDAGALDASTFEVFLASELRIAHQCGAALALGMCMVDEATAIVPRQPPERGRTRLGVGRMGPDRLALFKRHDSTEEARRSLEEAQRHFVNGGVEWALAILSLDASAVGLLDARAALDLAAAAAVEARGRGDSRVQLKLVVEAPAPG